MVHLFLLRGDLDRGTHYPTTATAMWCLLEAVQSQTNLFLANRRCCCDSHLPPTSSSHNLPSIDVARVLDPWFDYWQFPNLWTQI